MKTMPRTANPATVPTVTTTTSPPPDTTQEAPATPPPTPRPIVLGFKRFTYGLTMLITIPITATYIYHATTHSKTISSHPTLLQQPNPSIAFTWEKIGLGFAIARTIFSGLTIFIIPTSPEWTIFAFSAFNLAFEIPMALAAESSFGTNVAWSNLDLVPRTPLCYASYMSAQQWGFYTAYGRVVGRGPGNVCAQFVWEGNMLRTSVLFPWFTLWISLFVIAFFGAAYEKERKPSSFLVCLTGVEVESWRRLLTVKTPGFRVPRLRGRGRRGSESRASTLVDEEMVVVVKADEK